MNKDFNMYVMVLDTHLVKYLVYKDADISDFIDIELKVLRNIYDNQYKLFEEYGGFLMGLN